MTAVRAWAGEPTGELVAELVALAERVAREAGALIGRRETGRVAVESVKSSPTDVVTAMDTACEELIRQRLRSARPDDAVHGEEQGRATGSTGLTWLIDPIDGTVNYLYGLPDFAVSVAVVVGDTRVPGGWSPVAGCVHNPPSGQTWTAGAGSGAWLDGRRLVAADPPPLDQALVGTGFGYRAQRRAGQARVVAALLPRIRDIRRLGSAAMDLCQTATGRLDAYYERGLQPWDMAAGMLVAREAGLVVRGLGSTPPGEELLIAARPPLVDILAAELAALDAASDPATSPGGPGGPG